MKSVRISSGECGLYIASLTEYSFNPEMDKLQMNIYRAFVQTVDYLSLINSLCAIGLVFDRFL